MRLGATGFVAFATMLAISSGALFSLVLQTAMIVWDRGLAFLRSRWVIGLALGVATFVVLLLSVQGGLFTYIVENLIFAQGAGEHRLDIYHYGTRAGAGARPGSASGSASGRGRSGGRTRRSTASG